MSTAIVKYKRAVRLMLRFAPSAIMPLSTALCLMHFLSTHGYNEAVIPSGAFILRSAVLAFAGLVILNIYSVGIVAGQNVPLARLGGGLRGCCFIARSQRRKVTAQLQSVLRRAVRS